MARAKDWYQQHLGLTPVEEPADGAAFYETGGVPFLLYPSSFAGTNQATAAGFTVDDFDAAISELRANGVTFEDYDLGDEFTTVDGVLTRPDGRRGAWFKDSEGNILGVSEGM
jgi:catechol 2,3-dioxygenase-like lactoylglutathione lyase family enzyme